MARTLTLAAATLAFAGLSAPAFADIVTKAVEYDVGGTAYEGYFAINDAAGDDQPLVVIVHDWDGLTDYEMRRAEMLAELGFAAFAIDAYGKGVRPTTLDDKKAESGRLYKDRELFRERLMGGLKAATGMDGVDDEDVVVIGYCFGGAFVQLFACDFAIAADDAQFGLSEVNWGILPGGLVGKVIVDGLSYRDAVWYAMTGEPFDGRKAAEIKLISKSVPADKLHETTMELAQSLCRKNPQTLRTIKESLRLVRGMSVDQAADYLLAKEREMRFMDPESGRAKAMKQFLDDKTYRPGIGEYRRDEA